MYKTPNNFAQLSPMWVEFHSRSVALPIGVVRVLVIFVFDVAAGVFCLLLLLD